MEDYYLFLDETKPNMHSSYFALGGYAISVSDYENILKPELTQIKLLNMPDPELPLHLYDMRKNIKGFEFLADTKIRNKLFEDIKKLLNSLDINVFCTSIDVKEYNSMYNSEHTNNVYNITLQIIIENFVHFLINNKATGSFYIESRTPKENKQLQNYFYKIMANGTLFLKSDSIQDRVSSLSFPLKSDNIIGVQLADFIPITLLRSISNSKDYYGINSIIKNKIYKGQNNDMEKRYGFKNLL